MESAKQNLTQKLQDATNILVTVSSNPSVDQLAACIGLTVMLNEAGKRATAVYSGETPSTIEFLRPAATLEKDTNSLRDFIIALDKAKADKLRYKVENDIVKIFITPYRTSLSQNDLDFSQGDFNVDVVVALGVHRQEDLDQAIIAHGRILHDATVMSINNTPDGELGSINWQDLTASSLSEQVASLASSFDKLKLDEQVATALLTGIVSETDRFSNAKTTAATMTLSASLIAAGADQQLVATELTKPAPQPDVAAPALPAESEPTPVESSTHEPSQSPRDDGSLVLDHTSQPSDDIHIDDNGGFAPLNNDDAPAAPTMLGQPPADSPLFTASAHNDDADAMINPLTDSSDTPAAEPEQILHRSSSAVIMPAPEAPEVSTVPEPPVQSLAGIMEDDAKTLAELEADLNSARSAVDDAINSSVNQTPEPIIALNAQPLGNPQDSAVTPEAPIVTDTVRQFAHSEAAPGLTPADQPMDMPLPTVMPPQSGASNQPLVSPTSPPPVPPPMVPPFPQ